MTPPRLIEFECPACHNAHWDIDSDYRGADMVGGIELPYAEREYSCPSCNRRHPGLAILQASPPEFLLQPHPMYPMTARDFDYWVGLLREHFPQHPRVANLGTEFRPNDRRLSTWLRNVFLNRRYYLGRTRRQIRKWLGTGS
jgi:hypothetical protein